jgi:asparagine synthase (glutamine-hydrolysing)
MGHPVFPDGESFWKDARKIAFHQDEPIGSSSAFAQWSVMRAARAQGAPVVLGGQGGDELLCGYSKYQYFHLWSLLRRASPQFLRESLLWARNGTSSYRNAASVARYLPGPLASKWSLTRRLATPELRDEFRETRSTLGAKRTIAERQKVDLTYASLPALLHHEDRNSMAHSVESRLPFLDYRLVEFAVRCPTALKLRNGWSKWLLREALDGTLPDSVRWRKTKLGFDTPEAQWMRTGLQNGHRHLLESRELRMERFLSSESLARECSEFLRGSPLALPAYSIFRAVSLELWASVFQVS